MIPVEAVDAVRAIILPYVDDEHFDLSDIAQTALEAAAPWMLAAAWEAGYMCSYDQERGGHGVGPIPVPDYLADDLKQWNPHRKDSL